MSKIHYQHGGENKLHTDVVVSWRVVGLNIVERLIRSIKENRGKN